MFGEDEFYDPSAGLFQYMFQNLNCTKLRRGGALYRFPVLVRFFFLLGSKLIVCQEC